MESFNIGKEKNTINLLKINYEQLISDMNLNLFVDPKLFENFCEILSDILSAEITPNFIPFLDQNLLDLMVRKLKRSLK